MAKRPTDTAEDMGPRMAKRPTDKTEDSGPRIVTQRRFASRGSDPTDPSGVNGKERKKGRERNTEAAHQTVRPHTKPCDRTNAKP